MQAKRDEYEEDIDIVHLAAELVVDTIVEPADLRAELIGRLAAAATKDRTFSADGTASPGLSACEKRTKRRPLCRDDGRCDSLLRLAASATIRCPPCAPTAIVYSGCHGTSDPGRGRRGDQRTAGARCGATGTRWRW